MLPIFLLLILDLVFFVLLPSPYIPGRDTITRFSEENIVLSTAVWGNLYLHFEMKVRHASVVNA